MKGCKTGLFVAMVSFFMVSHAFGQKKDAKPSNIKFTNQNNLLTITYDLPDGGKDVFYTVNLKVVDSSSHLIANPVSLTGDVGRGISGGPHKTIQWAYTKDSVKLSQRLGIFIDADPVIARGGPANALKSLIVPGLGDYYVYGKKGNPAFLITIAAYGCVGYGVYNLLQANNTYSQYEKATHQTDIDNYFNQATQQRSTGTTFVTIGAVIWGADVLNVLLKGITNQHVKNSGPKSAKLDWNLNVSPYGPGFNLTYKF